MTSYNLFGSILHTSIGNDIPIGKANLISFVLFDTISIDKTHERTCPKLVK